jgi:hypothetical protein
MTTGKHGNDKETKGRFHRRNRRPQKGKCLLGITESKKEMKIARLRRKRAIKSKAFGKILRQ